MSNYLRLDKARSEGFLRAATALLDAGADPSSGFWTEGKYPEFETALYGAAGVAHHAEMTRLLLERGANPNDEEAVYHSPTVHLLPNFDEYPVAYRDRSALGQRLKKSGVDLRNDKSLANIVVVDGQLVGTWKRTFGKDAVVVEVSLLATVNRSERKAVAAAATKYGEFLEMPVELVI